MDNGFLILFFQNKNLLLWLMKKILVLLLAGFLSLTINAQNKHFTIEEATLGLRSNLAPKNILQLTWVPEGNAFSFVTDDKENPALVRVQVPKMKSDTILFLKDLNEDTIFGRTQESLKRMPNLQWINGNTFYFKYKNQLFFVKKSTERRGNRYWVALQKDQTKLPENAENVNVEKVQMQYAYTIENNLFMHGAKWNTLQITNDENKGIVNGQSVHQNEFGIDGGIFFSPKGNYLAFYRMDETMVGDYPIIDWSVTPAVNKNKKYPMAGTASHHVTLGVFNPQTKTTVFMKTGLPAEQYLTCVTWSPDEQYVFIAILNRDQNHLWLNKYDAKTGDFIKTLFEETDPKYVQPQHSLEFLPGKNDEFVWWSQRDGFMHLYRYNTEGKLLNQITKGEWLVNDILGKNKSKKELIVAASKESPMSKNIYAVNWENGEMRRLDKDFGVHNAKVSDDGNYLIDNFSNPDLPRKIEVVSTQSKWNKILINSENPLAGFQRPEIKNITLKADDGTDLFGKIILPINFDSTKKYPVIVYLYNGPNVQLLNNGFPASGNLWYEYMAQKGYVVFTMDGRGSSNRGIKFEQVTFRHLGTVEMEDQLKGVDYLKSLSYVDSERMGVHGWSFGGFMTTSLMLRHPGVFKCAVAGGPVIDWKMYEIMYTERYMDTPQQNPEGYEEANLLTKTKNLKGKLLMIHGAQDGVVVWQHSIKFIKACVDNGVQLDYFVYPGHEHNVLGKDRVHLMQKISDYFDEHL